MPDEERKTNKLSVPVEKKKKALTPVYSDDEDEEVNHSS